MKKTLIIGYGNRDREDDGAGWHMLHQLAHFWQLNVPELPGDCVESADSQLKLLYLFQLLPEMAEDLADYDQVIFLDAHNSDQLNDVVFEVLAPQPSHSAFTHHLSAEELLWITQMLGKPLPEAWSVSVRGNSFQFSQELTPKTAASVQVAVQKVINLVTKPDSSPLEPSQPFDIIRYKATTHSLTQERKDVVREHACLLKVNGQHWLTFICSPVDLEAMAIGFLFNENVIDHLSDITELGLEMDSSVVSVTLNKSVDKPAAFHRTSTGIAINSTVSEHPQLDSFKLTANQITTMFQQFLTQQSLHKEVGGFHSAALCNAQSPIIVVEDLGRHNCLDKLSGLFLLRGKPFVPHVIVLSGRISSEMIAKSLPLGVEFLVSRTSPTSMAIETANRCGVTLVGYLRDSQFDIYSHPERVILDA
ncbi:MAG: formate dehydrogenase accessory sulfurtransferase FdhD [Anaerolineaceae bacterium]